jgi:hypothetical protein
MPPPFFGDLEKIVWQCLDVIDRIRHRVAVKSNVGNLAQDESGTDGIWIDGPFGISINHQHRWVRREGYSATIDLDTKSLWPVFLVLLEAKGEPADLERMRSTYPGKWNGRTRAQIYRRLRKSLDSIGITVEQRRLKPLNC